MINDFDHQPQNTEHSEEPIDSELFNSYLVQGVSSPACWLATETVSDDHCTVLLVFLVLIRPQYIHSVTGLVRLVIGRSSAY